MSIKIGNVENTTNTVSKKRGRKSKKEIEEAKKKLLSDTNNITENGFDWLYAISPKELATGLIDEFGINVVNAPSAPVVLVCADGSTRFLGRGLKSVSELQEEIKKGC